MRSSFALSAFAVLCCTGVLFAGDVLRFRGENSQGKFNESGLLDVWPEGGLTPKWIINELGDGWGSVIKVKDRLYLNCVDSEDPKKESIVCLDLDGKKLWQKQVGSVWKGQYAASRSTPTYVPDEKSGDGKLLVLSGIGDLFCLSAKDGTVLWQQEVSKNYDTQFGHWGIAENVVAADGKVFVTVGGKKALAVAYNIADGSLVWETAPLEEKCAYATPVLHDGKLLVLTAKNVAMIDAKTGALIWKDDFLETTGGPVRLSGIHCNPFLIKENRFFVAQGYGQGCAMYEFLPDGKGAKLCWANKAIDPHHHGVVEIDGRVYGSNFRGKWCCIDWNTGDTVYAENWEGAGKGVTILADGKLIQYDEKRGNLGLAKPGDAFQVISAFPIEFGTGEHWSHPIVCDGILYVRHGKSLAAYDIKKQ